MRPVLYLYESYGPPKHTMVYGQTDHKLQSGLVRSCIYVYYKQERPGTEAYFEEIKRLVLRELSYSRFECD